MTLEGGLDPSGCLASDLWLDQPGAPAEIEARRAAGRLAPAEAGAFADLERRGYCVLRPAIRGSLFAELDADVERLWREQPADVAYAYRSILTRFSGRDAERRLPSVRVADLHTYSPAALELFLLPEVHAAVEAILGEPAVATQSLYFEWGSQQPLHRDPVHVFMRPPSHLVAAWIALEEITPDSGPLLYVPGSHRLPYYQFGPGRFQFDHGRDDDRSALACQEWDLSHCREVGLAPEPFLARRGEVLLWHHSLLHGGAPPTAPGKTRKSLVVHFTSRARYPEQQNTYIDPFVRRPAGWAPPTVVYRTRRLLERDGRIGFSSPLAEQARADLAEVGALRQRVEDLDGQLRFVESTRVWKLRNAWRKLGRRRGP